MRIELMNLIISGNYVDLIGYLYNFRQIVNLRPSTGVITVSSLYIFHIFSSLNLETPSDVEKNKFKYIICSTYIKCLYYSRIIHQERKIFRILTSISVRHIDTK